MTTHEKQKLTEPSVKKLRMASTAVYLACEESVADDISNLLKWAANEIDRLNQTTDNSLTSPDDMGFPE